MADSLGFDDLMLRFRGRTRLTQRQLAARLGVNTRSIQAWESGASYPSTASLQALIGTYLDEGAFTVGDEAVEAESLWTSALENSARLRPPFERAWFDDLLAGKRGASHASGEAIGSPPRTSAQTLDWDGAPDDAGFVGRSREVDVLTRCVLDPDCRMVAVLGVGGVGKTRLAARVARAVAARFQYVYWRSVRNAPSVAEWLGGAISVLSDQALVPPESESARVTALLELLRVKRCLLILDNLETLLESGRSDGRYREDVGGYDALLRAVGQSSHESCLIVTSREAPSELAELQGERAAVRAVEVRGMGPTEAQLLLEDKKLRGDADAWTSLNQLEGGNCLALRVVGQTVRQVFGGDIAAFVTEAGGGLGPVYGGIRQLLESQLARLSPLERDVLRWLAVEREPATFADLATDHPGVDRAELLEVIDALGRRSLIEQSEPGFAFTLQSVVLEYITDVLVGAVTDEIEQAAPRLLVSQALLKPHAKDYVRRTQERLILRPVLDLLIAIYGSPQAAEKRLVEIVEQLRQGQRTDHGYAPGNLANLLRVLRGNLRGVDLSALQIRQAFLQDTDMQDASLRAADVAGCVLANAFSWPVCVALSGDGRYLTAGTSTGEAYLWRTANRTLLATLRAQAGMVISVALNHNGERLATCGDDGTANVWDARSSALIATLSGHVGGALAVALSGDGELVATGDAAGTVRVWSAGGGRMLASVAGHAGNIWGVAFDAGGTILASVSDTLVRVWATPDCRPVATLEGHHGANFSTAVSSDGRIVASGSFDGNVRIWQVDTGQLLATLPGHASGAWSVGLDADGRRLVSGSLDGSVRYWDTHERRLTATMLGHTGGVRSVCIARDASLSASASHDGSVRLWDREGRLAGELRGYTSGIRAIGLTANGRLCASGSFDRMVRLWDVPSQRVVETWAGHSGGVWALDINPDGDVVASGGDDGVLRVWRSGTSRVQLALRGHTSAIWSVSVSRNGRHIVSGSLDGTVRVWSTEQTGDGSVLDAQTGPVWAVDLTTDEQLLASSGVSGAITLWDMPTRKLLRTLHGHAGPIWSLAFSRDRHLLASASLDGTARLWDADTGACLGTAEGHTGGVWSVAMTPDGQLLASAGFDGTVRLWETSTLHELKVLRGHGAGVWSLAFDEPGQELASAGIDGAIAIWGVADGTLRHTLRLDRQYERLNIDGLAGVTEAQREAMLALGAVSQSAA